MKPYIDNNTRLRTLAKTDFEKNLYKLLNNSFFEKTMENIRNRLKVDIPTTQLQAKRLQSKPMFETAHIIDENMAIYESKYKSVKFDKPIYLGACILDLSKLLMYQFYYNIVEKTWNNNEILYMDTDSLILNIYSEDVYKDMKNIEDQFDFSGYLKDHFLFSEKNKKVIGKMKDELNSKIMTEIICLKAKAYFYKVENEEEEVKKLKGVSRASYFEKTDSF